MVGSNPSSSGGRSSDNDEDWDNLEAWGENPPMEGVIAPALREGTQISPTRSWDEGDEPWETVTEVPRGVGAPRSPVERLEMLRRMGENIPDVATGEDDDWGEAALWETVEPTPPPMEGVISPAVQERPAETFSWGRGTDSWDEQASTSRGIGRPRTEAERLDELRRRGQNVENVMPTADTGGGWADAQGWVVRERGPTPPPMEGVLSPSVRRQQGVAQTFDLGEGHIPASGVEASRGMGRPRSDVERVEMMRQEGQNVGDVLAAGEDWASNASWGQDPEAVRMQIPQREGVLAEGAREEQRFAEDYRWGEGVGVEMEWDEGGGVERGVGAPIASAQRMQEQRLQLTTYEQELLRQQEPHGIVAGDWALNLPRGEVVRSGDEVERWASVLAPTGVLPAPPPGVQLQPEREIDHEKGSDATPSSFDSEKEFNLIKEISTRFLPDFASDENRALNILVQEAERALRDVEDLTLEQDDRTAVMEDHMKRVQEEIAATQLRVEAKRREIATEEHLKTMTAFQAARLKREVVKMENEMHEMLERLRNFRTSIFHGNEKLDHIRLVQHWNQQELEQWVQAAMQKDEDWVALASYTKNDTTQMKALRLQESQASGELATLENLLEAEMSETQSYQIQLDRTAEEFRKLHLERQKVIRMWEDAIELVHHRDEDIHRTTDEFASFKGQTRNGTRILDRLDLKLYNAVENNKDLERAIFLKNLDAQRQRDFLRIETESTARTREELVLIRTNHLRAQHRHAKEVAKKIHFEEEIIRQKKMYKDAKRKLRHMRKLVEDEYDHLDTLEKRTHALDKMLNTEELNLKMAKREVSDLRERHFKASEELFSLKAAEANTVHEITGGKSQAKTLVNKIIVFEMEMLKKEEKLYAAEFQIQLLERKVGRASGERSNLEELETTRIIKELEGTLNDVKHEEASVNAQLKKSHEDWRSGSVRKEELLKRNKKVEDKNAELDLECDTGLITNKQLMKDKEEVALEADLLHMEVNRLTDLLHSKADEVFSLDRLKQRLQQNMEDRKAEVDLRQDIQRREMKSISEELHALMLKRKHLILMIDKFQCKYGCLRARMKANDGVEITAEYFLQKLAKEREEVQQKGIELQKEVKKAKVDVDFLEKANQQIVASNNNLRTSLTESEKTHELEEETKSLKEDLGKSRERARFKEREERSLLQDLAEVDSQVENTEKECEIVTKTCQNLEFKVEMAEKDGNEQTIKRKRAAIRLNSLMRELKEKSTVAEAKKIGNEFFLTEIREITKDVLYKLRILALDNPDYASVIEKRVANEGFKLPSGSASVRSSVSGSSVGSVSSKEGVNSNRHRKKKSPKTGSPKIGRSQSPIRSGGGRSIVKVEFKD